MGGTISSDELWDRFDEETEKANIAMACAETYHANAADQLKRAREHMFNARQAQRTLMRKENVGTK